MRIVKFTAAAALGAAAALLFVYFALAGMLVDAVFRIGGEAAVPAWSAAEGAERVYITADDGVTLSALDMSREPTGKWALLLHGYTGGKEDMLIYAREYISRGWSVLIPDQRAHGESGGEYCTMGSKERLDAIAWVDYILEREPGAEVVIHGVSMGAATAVMAAGEGLPDNVRAVISDCAFTDVKSIMEYQLASCIDDSALLLVPGGSVVSRLRAGFGWGETSVTEAAARSKTPMLFIHGETDDFVPAEMALELYEAAAEEKEILLIPGAGHAASVYSDTEKYWTAVFDFEAKHSSMHKNG